MSAVFLLLESLMISLLAGAACLTAGRPPESAGGLGMVSAARLR